MGTEISSFPGIGPGTALKVLHENPTFSSIAAFTEFLFELKKTNVLDRPTILRAINEGYDFFDNAPVVYDPRSKKILCELRTRKVLDGNEPVFEGGIRRLTILLDDAYNMQRRWNCDDNPFNYSLPFQSPLLLPYFEPQKNTTEMIPGAHLKDTSEGSLSKISTNVQKEFLKTRLVCGLSSVSGDDLRTLVIQHVNMEKSASPLITGSHNLSVELLSFMAGRIHARDVSFFNIPPSLSLHQYLSWALPGDREKMKLLVAHTVHQEMFLKPGHPLHWLIKRKNNI